MGKKAREKKLEKIEQEMAEKQAIEQRRAERTAPIIRMVKRLTVAVVATGVILYLGVIINSKLPEILNGLAQRGN
jgi:hypothetical protein